MIMISTMEKDALGEIGNISMGSLLLPFQVSSSKSYYNTHHWLTTRRSYLAPLRHPML